MKEESQIEKSVQEKDNVLSKIKTEDSQMKEKIENLLKNKDYNLCPYAIRIYDFIQRGISSENNNKKQIGVQCLYNGTVQNPIEKCIGNFENCEKYKQLQMHEEFMKK
jgi:hypothetical protein